VIEYYLQRWMIELFFKLTSGCKIESRCVEHMDRSMSELALYLIVAWRSLYVCRMSRTHAGKSCTSLNTKAEWKSVWQVVKRSRLPKKPPTLLVITQLVVQLGGCVNRKNAGPPDPQTVWQGLQAMYLIAIFGILSLPSSTAARMRSRESILNAFIFSPPWLGW
jgi:Transposase Tn5 dimerisation domain